MIKNLLKYIYSIILALILFMILGLYNKIKKIEIELLSSRELKTIIDNTDIKVCSISKKIDEMDKKPEPPIPEPGPKPDFNPEPKPEPVLILEEGFGEEFVEDLEAPPVYGVRYYEPEKSMRNIFGGQEEIKEIEESEDDGSITELDPDPSSINI